MGSPSMPRVSFGLPVYNSEELVRTAIDSILGQTFADIELVISDNCSTDSTEEICRSYAARDPRVVYSRTPQNLGAAGNFTRVAELARGEYFKWISHDDWVSPDFAEQCLAIAETDSEIVTVAPLLDVVDRQKKHVQTVSSYIGRKQWSHDRLAQYREMMDELAYCETHDDGLFMCAYVYAFHRRKLLQKTRLLMPFVSSDYVLAAELALAGRLVQLDRVLSFFTISTSSGGTSANFSTWNPAAIQRMLAPGRSGRMEVLMSVRRRHFEHVSAVLRSSLGPSDKMLAVEAATRPMLSRFLKRATRKWNSSGA